MKHKVSYFSIWAAFFTLNIFFHNGLVFSSQEANNEDSELTINYLKKLPLSDYILGPGDYIKINVSRDYPELDSLIRIDGEGTIYLPKLKRVFVEGLSISELNKLLTKAFKEFVKYPDVETEVVEYRPIRVYIDGEVENPGLQTLSGSLFINSKLENNMDINNNIQNNLGQKTNYFPTVFDAIRSAGGITRNSNLREVELIRIDSLTNGGGRKKTILDFEKVIFNGDVSQNIRIYDGDTIKIKKDEKNNLLQITKASKSNLNKKFINVTVSGRVNVPGSLRLSKISTLNDAIDIAGGAKILKGKTRFLRLNNDGSIDKRKIKYSKANARGSYKNPYLKEGDLIFVDNSILSSTNEVISEITQPLTGVFSAYGLIKAFSD